MAENELAEVVGDVPAIPAEEVPAEATPETPAAETPPVDEAPDAEALQADIAALQKQKEDAKQAAQKWRKEKADARADYFKSRQPAPEPTPAPAATAKPDPNSFVDYNDYVDALTDWKVDQKKAGWDAEQIAKEQGNAHQEKMTRLQEKINRGFEKYPDFEDVALAETVPITPMIQEILAETENPDDVAYHLGKNQTQCIAIGRMTPIAASRAIAQIEAELSGGAPAAPATPKKTTSAPPPITPVGSSNPAGSKPLDEMTQAEFEAERKKQGARQY